MRKGKDLKGLKVKTLSGTEKKKMAGVSILK